MKDVKVSTSLLHEVVWAFYQTNPFPLQSRFLKASQSDSKTKHQTQALIFTISFGRSIVLIGNAELNLNRIESIACKSIKVTF